MVQRTTNAGGQLAHQRIFLVLHFFDGPLLLRAELRGGGIVVGRHQAHV